MNTGIIEDPNQQIVCSDCGKKAPAVLTRLADGRLVRYEGCLPCIIVNTLKRDAGFIGAEFTEEEIQEQAQGHLQRMRAG